MSSLNWFRQKLLGKKHAYRRMFLGDDGLPHLYGRIVIADLRAFCRGDQSTTMVSPVSRTVDPIASAQAEGRREVYQRLLQMLYLPDKVITELEDPENE